MKFIVTKTNLLEALTVAGKCIGAGKNIMPILDNYKLEVDGQTLTVTGSSMDIFISTKCACESEKLKIAFCLPAPRLMGLVKELPEQPLYFELVQVAADEKTKKPAYYRAKITTLSGEYNIPCEDAESFPESKHKSLAEFEVPSGVLISGLNKTLFACHQIDDGSAVTCCSISLDGSHATFIGTDKNLLSCFSFAADSTVKQRFLVPPKVLTILLALPMDINLKMSLDKNNIRIIVNEETVLTGTLNGEKYPDCEALIRQFVEVNNIKLSISRHELISSLKRVSTFSNTITHQVRLTLANGSLTIESENIDYEEDGVERLKCTAEGEIVIGLNAKYAISCLTKLTGDMVYFHLSTPNRAVIIRESENDGFTDLMLLMPIMLNHHK